jgi:hypothetical protein
MASLGEEDQDGPVVTHAAMPVVLIDRDNARSFAVGPSLAYSCLGSAIFSGHVRIPGKRG